MKGILISSIPEAFLLDNFVRRRKNALLTRIGVEIVRDNVD